MEIYPEECKGCLTREKCFFMHFDDSYKCICKTCIIKMVCSDSCEKRYSQYKSALNSRAYKEYIKRKDMNNDTY
jgi:hypothetical protein